MIVPLHNPSGQRQGQVWESCKSYLKLEWKSMAINNMEIFLASSEVELPR